MAGASAEQQNMLANYGRNFGLAFQIVDDLLDVQGSEAAAGKRVGKDSNRGKLTFPRILGEDESRRRAEQLIEEAAAAIAPFGAAADRLNALAQHMLERNH